MIQGLRRRFIGVTMLAFAAVLTLVLTAVNLVYRHNAYAAADQRLDYLAESAIGPPAGMMAITPPEMRLWIEQNAEGIMDEQSYFIVSGYMQADVRRLTFMSLSQAMGVDAERLAADILAGGRSRGNVGAYRYYAAERGPGYKLVFLNCEKERASMRSLLNTSVAVGLVSLGLGLCFAALLSGRLVKPFAENAENQKRFISNASHELKTPLGVIMSDIDMQIMEGGETEWLQNAMVQADHLAMLIERLTDYALIDERRQRGDEGPVDISGAAEALAEAYRPLALTRGQELAADIEPGVLVRGDCEAFRTVLSILLDNAVKYAPEGGRIWLSVRRERRAAVEVVNTCEADGADMSRVFERFYRAPGRQGDQRGHGLGLSIAREIVEMYGGTIRAEARPDGTAAFTVEF